MANQDEFDTVLEDMVDEETDVLSIPGAYEVLSDYFNNDVLEEAEAEDIDLEKVEFDGILTQIVQRTSAAELLRIPGFYEIAAEALNNDVLRRLRAFDSNDFGDEDEFEYPDQDVLHSAYVVQDARGGYELVHRGRVVAYSTEFDDLVTTARREMKRHNYYPDLYYVNDHGNLSLLNQYGRELHSWV